MHVLYDILDFWSNEPIFILDDQFKIQDYTPIDLSVTNAELASYDLTDNVACQHYIDSVLKSLGGSVAYGGYLEKRSLYSDKSAFSIEGIPRNIHLGMDFWAKADTKVLAPIDGKIHSFKDNGTFGDYGPTIILQHEIGNLTFFTLYGHLSRESLKELYIGKEFKKGDALATLGTPNINVGYAPHLHFQIIHDIERYFGDYPGVCTEQNLEFYAKNCPDPNLLLKIQS